MARGKPYEGYVQKAKPWWKVITGILFSNAGLFIVSMAYGALGAYVFLHFERPAEDLR